MFRIPLQSIRLHVLFQWLLPVLVAGVFSGCDKFDGTQTIPSYLRVDSIGFSTNYASQGTDDQKFVDIWIYVDDEEIGGFEMPAEIPILAEGSHKLELRPGIKLNGISDTRSPYPCAEPIIFSTFELIPDSVVKAGGTSNYYDNAQFVWMEDFEDESLAIQPIEASDTSILRTDPAGNPDAYLDENSEYSGICYLDDERDYLVLVSDDGNGEGFAFDRGDFIFLEFHFKMDVPLLIGTYIKLSDNSIEDRAYVVLNPTETWKKIYINFTPMVNETTDAVNFKIYFQAMKPSDVSEAFVMFDNIKLVTRPNL